MLKKIGSSDLEICPIGQGTLFGRTSSKINEEIIKKKIDVLNYGLELGMNFIDTGEDYEDGLSEKLLSKVVKSKRDKIVIGSKFKPSKVNVGKEAHCITLKEKLPLTTSTVE